MAGFGTMAGLRQVTCHSCPPPFRGGMMAYAGKYPAVLLAGSPEHGEPLNQRCRGGYGQRRVALGCKRLEAEMLEMRGFQKRFVKHALAPGVDVAALSIPRGNGKSWLAAHLLTRGLTPGDDLYVKGAEYLLCAASLEQARLCYRFIRADLEPTGAYSFIDSSTRLSITHKATHTRLRVLSSNGKTAMGIVGCPLLVADEPGSWEVTGGTLMFDAIVTALGKPSSPMKAVFHWDAGTVNVWMVA